jgi:hypothetical protein
LEKSKNISYSLDSYSLEEDALKQKDNKITNIDKNNFIKPFLKLTKNKKLKRKKSKTKRMRLYEFKRKII